MRYRAAVIPSLGSAPLAAQQPAESLVVVWSGGTTALHDLAGPPRGTVSASAHDGTTRRYSGVMLWRVVERAGIPVTHLRGPALARQVVVEAKDRYRVAFGIADLDTSFVGQPVLVADSVDGHPLPAEDGVWRLIVPSDRRSARSVRMLRVIRVIDPPLP